MSLVLFIDMDSFYASCELLRRPELRGKAFIVGTGDEKNRHKGVVEAASYAAKKAGVKSGIPTIMAFKIKQDLVYVPSDHEFYEETSMKVMKLLHEFGFKMETMSVDEAALDLGEITYEQSEKIAKEVKEKINNTLGLPCTVGVTVGKVFAKMVCDSAKPDGLKVLRESDIVAFLENRDVRAIPGVGGKTEERLNEMGIKKIGDISKFSPDMLQQKLGSFGRELHMLSKGRDDSKVIEAWKVLSISRERTLDRKNNDLKEIDLMLDKLSDEVIQDVRKNGFAFKTVTVKGKYVDFTDRIKGKSLKDYSDSVDLLKSMSHSLIREIMIDDKPFRKIGVRVSSFTESRGQKKLF